MSFVLLSTDLTTMRREIAQYAHGVDLVARSPEQLLRDEWNAAELVLIDTQAAPMLRARPHPLPSHEKVLPLVDFEDRGEPDLNQHAAALGVVGLVTLPDPSGVLHRHLSTLVQRPATVAGVLDPQLAGDIGTATIASLAMAGVAAGKHLAVLDARSARRDLHRALQQARHDAPAIGSGNLRTLSVPDQHPPTVETVHAMVERVRDHPVTLVHLDPHQSATETVLTGVDVIIILVRARAVTANVTRRVVAVAHRATPHVYMCMPSGDASRQRHARRGRCRSSGRLPEHHRPSPSTTRRPHRATSTPCLAIPTTSDGSGR